VKTTRHFDRLTRKRLSSITSEASLGTLLDRCDAQEPHQDRAAILSSRG
jgi:hypothetical protein